MSFPLPLRGAQNPSSTRAGTNPGSFAEAPALGQARTYSSPDTPGMPAPSDKTAWDFLPPGFERNGQFAVAPAGYEPKTQLEFARLGVDRKSVV